jgi:hypothetical protein
LIELIDQATALDLPVEIARTRMALARIMLSHTPSSESGRTLLEAAQRDLISLGALADAYSLPLPR